MPNNCLSVLYKHIIQVENKNVGLKVGGHKHIFDWGGTCPPCPPPPPPPLPTPVNSSVTVIGGAVMKHLTSFYRYRQ